MSRFIFYSGLVHCVAFVGVVTYMSTRPKEGLPEFLQSTPKVDTTSSREIVELGVASGSIARQEVADSDSNRELRERKVRANLPTPPETPRVVDKVNAARKMPTQLPQKKGVTNTTNDSASNSVPEMGHDIPVEPTQAMASAATMTEENDLDKTAEDVAAAIADETVTENENSDETEKLQIAAFDVDELAENHLQKLKEKEELEHKDRMTKLAAEREAAMLALAKEKESEESAAAALAASDAGASQAQESAPTAAVENLSAQASGSGQGLPDADEVRSLSEIRQSPGNKAPKYDVDDRKSGRQGLVVFLAYIKADGSPKEFQLASSSGHRSLDAKTLKALKGWKFQPGQEGWVEIPFQWDLKGGAQEAPSNLRRQGSR